MDIRRRLTQFGIVAVVLLLTLADGSLATAQTPPLADPTPVPKTAASPSPAAKTAASPAAVAKPTAASPAAEPGWGWINNYVNLTALLTTLGLLLAGAALVCWNMSNLAERTPNAEQLEEMKRFVEEDFARYIADNVGLTRAADLPVAFSKDHGWRKLFVHHVQLHNELYQFSTKAALSFYTRCIDDAVRREVASRERSRPELIA